MPEDQKPQEPQQDKPEKTDDEKVKELLSTVVGAFNVEGAGETMITQLDVLSSQWRQTWTAILKHTDPEGRDEYKAMKYPPGVENPDITIRRAAYEYVVVRLIDKHVTDIEPLEPSNEHSAIVALVRRAVATLKVIAPEDYAGVMAMLYAAPFDLDNRRAAYKAASKLFLQKTYKLANV